MIAEHMAGTTGLTKKAVDQLLDDCAALAYKEAEHLRNSSTWDRQTRICKPQSEAQNQ